MKNIVMIPIGNLLPHPDNPRKNLGDLTELTDAIKAKGILQNLTVVPFWSTQHERIMDGIYTVIIGHRRMEAAKLAGLTEVPCVIADMTPREQFETMMVENIQRSDLTVREQAEGFQLMLDMGDTVEEVAKKTGVSQTTVRNRAKLSKLNKAGFKKAEERGATLADFLKLNAIKDEGQRNKVLEYIGTADFNHKYQVAIGAQEDAEWLAETAKALRESDWCDELTPEQLTDLKDKFIRFHYTYGPWNKRPVEKPTDAGTGSKNLYLYFFIVNKKQIDVYREMKKDDKDAATGTSTAQEISPARKRKQEVAEEIDGLTRECEAMFQDFRNLRDDFIIGFDRFARYQEEIQAFLIKATLFRDIPGYFSQPKIDQEELANMLGLEYDKKAKAPQKDAFNCLMRNQPERVMLYVAYLLLEDGNREWMDRCYDNRLDTFLPQFKYDKQLDLLYACLESLGYERCSEEKEAALGNVSQFREAKALVSEYVEEYLK